MSIAETLSLILTLSSPIPLALLGGVLSDRLLGDPVPGALVGIVLGCLIFLFGLFVVFPYFSKENSQ